MSKCNMNNQVREDARQALGELKASIYKNFERIKSAYFLEACKESLKEAIASQVTPKRSYANGVAPSAKINPAESKLGVCDLKNIRGNKLLVKCVSENDRDRLLTEIQEKSPEIKASVPKRRKPAIIVKNVPNEVKNEDLFKVITEQNPEIVVDDESIRQCIVRFTLKTFQHTRHVVIETHPTQLILNIEADNIDCALVQEPHSYRSTLPLYPSTYRLFYDPNSDFIKAAIIVRSPHLSTFIDYKNSDYNMVTLEVIAGSTAFTLFSYYFEPSKNIDSDLHKISQVFSSKNLNRLVWSMDSNSKSELWFSPYSDARGNKLSEFISANNLFIINEDCGPTFRATQGTSYIDITVVGSDLLEDNSS
ncbi:hypothetical protein TNCV_3152771 [Trichonephila clavipes]|nr:hypothetical protein TNCV_3152771 [Trichonephila clavipes]